MSPEELPPDDAFVRTAIRGMQTPDHHPDFWDDLASLMDEAEDRNRPFVDAGLDAALGAPREFEMPGPSPRGGRHVHARPAHRAGDHSARRAPLRAAPLPSVANLPPLAAEPALPPLPAALEPAADREPPLGLDWDAPPVPEPPPEPQLAPGPVDVPRQVHIAAPTAAVPAAAAAFAPATKPKASAPGPSAHAIRKVADPLSKLKVEHDAATMPFSMRRTSNVVLLTVALMAVMIAVFAGLSLVRQRSDTGAPAPLEQLAA